MNYKKIKKMLKDKGLRQVDLMGATGLSFIAINQLLNGYRQPKDEHVKNIAKRLGVDKKEIE